jgi:arylsulfatase A-like enzyme
LRLFAKPENVEGRFFCWLHFFDPHSQYMPHEGAPDFRGGASSPVAIAKAAYDGEVWFMDRELGRVLEYIEGQPWGAKTAIVVTADHGEAFADHGMNFHGIELWESLVHVPLIVYLPGIEPHRVPVKRSHIDLVPTLLDILKIPAEVADAPALRGTSWLPDLYPAGREYEERDVYIDMPAGPYNLPRRAFLHGETPGQKLIHFGAAVYQLFDLDGDPGERADLASDKAKLVPMVQAYQAFRAGLQEIDVKPQSTP